MNKTIDKGRRSALLTGLGAATGLVTAAALPGCGGGATDEHQAEEGGPRQRPAAVTPPSALTTYVVPEAGVTIPRYGDLTPYVYTPPNSLDRLQAFAGPNSRGLLDRQLLPIRRATPLSVQFGTSQLGPNQGYWQANTAHMEGSESPTSVFVEASTGHHFLGETDSDKRVHWNKLNSRLTMMQLKGDHYVSGNPRVQLNGHPVPTKTWLRFYCHFELGNRYVDWPAGRDSTLIFQLKGDATAFPPLTLDVWKNDLDSNLVDVVLIRRTVNASPIEPVFKVKGLAKLTAHRFVIDVYPNWETGQASLSLWFNGQRVSVIGTSGQFALTDPTIYPIKDLYHPMWGIYRYLYKEGNDPVPDHAAIVWHRAEVQWKAGAPTNVLPVPEN